MVGRTLGGRYVVEARVGGGGMATVYRGLDTYLQRQVALKVLRPHFAGDAEFVARFRREARAAASLSHPNIVAVYDVGQDGEDCYYIVQEFVDGRTLKDRIREEGPLPPAEALRVVLQVLRALGHAHAAGIIHRDVKPQNVLLTRDGQVKVTDFGIARAESGATLVPSGAIVGTAHYAAPEQVRGQATDERCDLYSTGVMLYEMLTGRPPFDGDGPLAVALQHIERPVPDPADVRPDLPPAVCAIVRHAMGKLPGERYASTAEFAEDVVAVLAGRPPAHALAGPGGRGRAAEPEPREEAGGSGEPTGGGGEVPRGAVLAGVAAPRPRRGRWRAVAAAALAAGLVAAGGGVGVARLLYVGTVTVPNVAGDDLTTAQQVLAQADLRYVVRQENDPTVPAGEVVRTVPAAGTAVRRGHQVEIWQSLGPALVQVPDVTGLDRAAAATELTQMGLQVQISPLPQFSGSVPAGSVLASLPGPGARVPAGSTVTLTLSAGPPSSGAVPDYTGQPASAVEADLAQRGWKLGTVTQQRSGWPAGIVVATDPPAGTPALPGTTVQLTVSSGCLYQAARTFRAGLAGGPPLGAVGTGIGTPGFSGTSAGGPGPGGGSSASASGGGQGPSSASSAGPAAPPALQERVTLTDGGPGGPQRTVFDQQVAPGVAFTVTFCWASPQGAAYTWEENGVVRATGQLGPADAAGGAADAAGARPSTAAPGGGKT